MSGLYDTLSKLAFWLWGLTRAVPAPLTCSDAPLKLCAPARNFVSNRTKPSVLSVMLAVNV